MNTMLVFLPSLSIRLSGLITMARSLFTLFKLSDDDFLIVDEEDSFSLYSVEYACDLFTYRRV